MNGNENSRRALIIANPAAGKRGIEQKLPRVKEIFEGSGYTVEAELTSYPGEAEELAFNKAAGHDLIVSAGGDGTLYQVVNGLMKSGARIPVGHIPCGSTNEFASAHGMPRLITEAAKRIASGEDRAIDVGVFGDRYFLGTAAFGAFSWMGYSTDQSLKNKLGYTAYVIEGLKGIKKNVPHHVRISADGEVHEGDYIFGAVCATKELSRRIGRKDRGGALELLLVKDVKSISDAGSILRSLSTGRYEDSALFFTFADDIVIENEKGLVWSIGGESSGEFDTVRVGSLSGGLLIRGASKRGAE